MANTTKILEALSAYKGDSDSLNRFVTVVESELGSDWTGTIYNALPNLPTSLKEKLDHAFNYFGATASWNEIQEYLSQTTPLNLEEVSSRLETLEYWLNFFGEAGRNTIHQLQEKMTLQQENEQTYPIQEEESAYIDQENYPSIVDETYQETFEDSQQGTFNEQGIDETYQPETTIESEEPIYEEDSFYEQEEPYENTVQEIIYEEPLEEDYLPTEATTDELPADPQDFPPDNSQEEYTQEHSTEDEWKSPVYIQQKADTNEQFMAKKTFRQLEFSNAVHSWINARCISLGNIEIYAYKYYGFLVDTMEETKKDIQEVLSNPAYYPAIEETRKDGLKTLQNSLLSLEKDLKVAYDNAQTDITPLIAEDLNSLAAKNALGSLDATNKKEYLGPAPDGFEMVDDPYENTDDDETTTHPTKGAKNIQAQAKSTSQTTQNSVQRKISFALNKKNPSGTV